jgi:hypothetical protein
MKYGKKIETFSASRRREKWNEPRRMKNPYRAEEYDFTTIIPRARSCYSENYGAGWIRMRRFFESRIGQQWNKVWSEFCGKATVWWMTRDTIGQGYGHAMVHLRVHIRGGVVCRPSSYYGEEPLHFDDRRALFVHPRTGQLCGAKTHARKQKRALRKNWYAAPIQS